MLYEDEEEEEGELADPQITSTNPQERKLARKLRINRRLEAARKLNLPPGEVEPVIAELSVTEKQIDNSWELLQKKITIGEDYITNLRVATNCREVQRRKDAVADRKRVLAKIEEEALLAQDMYNNITKKWTPIIGSTDPLYINNELLNQKAKCDELIAQKDAIIEMLRGELSYQDNRFTSDQRKQQDDLKTLCQRIDRQTILMKKAYRSELNMIEEAIMTDRLMHLDSQKKRWDQFYSQLGNDEESNLMTKMETLSKCQDEMHLLLLKHQERFRETKINLGSDIETLQRELQKLRAECLLNGEKFDYNYQILKRREDENMIVKSQQKRLMNKLQDTVNKIKKKIVQVKKESEEETEKITAEIMKLHASILDIESKADHFSKMNDKNYREVWDLNYSEAEKLLQKIMSIDCILYEQQMGIPWNSPDRGLPHVAELPSYRSAVMEIGEMIANSSKTKNQHVANEFSPEEEIYKVSLLRRLLRLIANRSGFLIENRLAILLNPYFEDEQTVIRLDNVFAALNVCQDKDVETLLDFFMPYTFCPVCGSEGKTFVETISELELNDENVALASQMSISSNKDSSVIVNESKDVINMFRPSDAMFELNMKAVGDDLHSEFSSISCSRAKETDESYTLIQGVDENHSDGQGGRTQSYHPNDLGIKASFGVFEKPSEKKERHRKRLKCPQNHPLKINPAYILRGLRDFAASLNSMKENEQVTMSNRLSRKRSTISRSIAQEDVQSFWEKFREIFSSNRERIWDALMFALTKYHSILKDRKRIVDEVIQLRKQNKELKTMLRNMCGYTDSVFLPPLSNYTSTSRTSNVSSLRSGLQSKHKNNLQN